MIQIQTHLVSKVRFNRNVVELFQSNSIEEVKVKHKEHLFYIVNRFNHITCSTLLITFFNLYTAESPKHVSKPVHQCQLLSQSQNAVRHHKGIFVVLCVS